MPFFIEGRCFPHYWIRRQYEWERTLQVPLWKKRVLLFWETTVFLLTVISLALLYVQAHRVCGLEFRQNWTKKWTLNGMGKKQEGYCLCLLSSEWGYFIRWQDNIHVLMTTNIRESMWPTYVLCQHWNGNEKKNVYSSQQLHISTTDVWKVLFFDQQHVPYWGSRSDKDGMDPFSDSSWMEQF